MHNSSNGYSAKHIANLCLKHAPTVLVKKRDRNIHETEHTYIKQNETSVSYIEIISGIIIASLIGTFIFIIRPRLLDDKN